jgi:hypothetical protein
MNQGEQQGGGDMRRTVRGRRFRRRDRGSALVLVTIIGAMLLVLVGVLIDSSMSGSRAASATYHHSAAHLTAMSGVWAGCNSLSQARSGNTSGTVGSGAWSPVASGDDLDGDEFIDFSSDATFLALGDGYFESRSRLLGTSGYTIRARGVHGGVFRTIEAVVMPSGYTGSKPFSRAIFAAQDLLVGGSTTFDSFNSSVGPWSAHATTETDAGGRPIKNRNGSVASNQRIDLTGSTSVYGNARPGPSGAISIGGSCLVTGSTAALSEAEAYYPPLWTVPPVTDALVNTAALGVIYDTPFRASSGTRTMGPGKYVVKSFQLSGSAAIDVTGTPGEVVEIYVTGGGSAADAPSFSLADSSQFRLAPNGPTVKIYNVGKLRTQSTAQLNPTGTLAAQLQYFSHYASDNSSDLGLDLGSSADQAAVFYAPRANVRLSSTANRYGSIIGRQVSVSGAAAFHFDEALRDLTLPYAGSSLFVPTATYDAP